SVMRLINLLPDSLSPATGKADLEITRIVSDSRQVVPGALYVAINGEQVDGRDFIPQALSKGASAILAQPKEGLSQSSEIIFTSEDPRKILSQIAANFYGKQPKHCAAVTGTNGKTSVASFVQQLWQSLDYSCASLGTIGLQTSLPLPPDLSKSTLTTPDTISLHEIVQKLGNIGIDHLIFEASSHGLKQYRTDGLALEVAAFTNISRDHLDYHATFEDYFVSKSRLFAECLPKGKTAVLNADIPEFETLKELCEQSGHKVLTYGKQGKEFRILDLQPSDNTLAIRCEILSKTHEIILPFIGEFQAMNLMCALAILYGTHQDQVLLEKAIQSIKHLKAPIGRLEFVGHTEKGSKVYVDFAHTPEALEMLLKTLRPHTDGKLAVVFGCGGDRDPGKRPLMGSVAQLCADRVIVTDDNPRTENPEKIRQQIIEKCPKALDIGDRAEAIYEAIQGLEQKDTLVIAGKGHEKGQIVMDKILPFEDQLVAQKAIRESA
ncbi:MAG: UDP-N-acetylmuramoyl-L-alanyl-D-glutamate--2,6-diaminopimelate ligase, partial [Alphaproteobacteria bacterium]|nr:UDP-N-acetylmuramoyl-L-alanyl-D-glutamate--2,6-diaminopimelate ligase [Alphaproteobacteria bacterium]